jgi:SAM-dependent methyltransferase
VIALSAVDRNLVPRDIDGLTSATLKHLRDRWWDGSFTTFLLETLQPRAGNRILDVGCGAGMAQVHLGLQHLSQVELFAVDVLVARLREGLAATRARNVRALFAAGDACHLPFAAGSFDSTFCVAVLQHVAEVAAALREFARVTKAGGRVLAVEPDNAARYWYSSLDSGRRTFEAGGQFFAALGLARGEAADPAVGPKLPALFTRAELEPLAVHLFPVSVSRLGAPPPTVWAARQEAVARSVNQAPDESIRRLGHDYLKLLGRYAEDATAAGPSFVEIQNTMLFATVGQKPDGY